MEQKEYNWYWPKQYPCTICGQNTKREDGDNHYKHKYRCVNKKCHRYDNPLYGAMRSDKDIEYGEDTCSGKKIRYSIDNVNLKILKREVVKKSNTEKRIQENEKSKVILNKLFYYSKYDEEWTNNKKFKNKYKEKLHYWYLKFGIFDINLWLVKKREKFKRWRKKDITYKNF